MRSTRCQIVIVQHDAIPVNFTTCKTIPHIVLKGLEVQSKLWELRWEVGNQKSRRTCQFIPAAITGYLTSSSLHITEIHFSGFWRLRSPRSGPQQTRLLVRTCLLLALLAVSSHSGKNKGSVWSLFHKSTNPVCKD